jgi:histidinol-phosphatase
MAGPRATGRPSTERLRRVAVEAARAGGRRTLEGFGRRVRAETKADGSPVTRFDRASEREIRRVIRRSFPDHAILGEEGGTRGRDGRVRWIVDPIDGTKSFVHGVPLYAVLVAVEVDRQPEVGVIHLPALDETVDAARGQGCRFQGRPAAVSRVGRLREATVLTTSVRGLEERGVPFRRLAAATKIQRGWGDAYGYALVATGRADAMLDSRVAVWDVAPLLPILTEAGGRFTDWRGRGSIEVTDALGTNGRLHPAMLRLLRG